MPIKINSRAIVRKRSSKPMATRLRDIDDLEHHATPFLYLLVTATALVAIGVGLYALRGGVA